MWFWWWNKDFGLAASEINSCHCPLVMFIVHPLFKKRKYKDKILKYNFVSWFVTVTVIHVVQIFAFRLHSTGQKSSATDALFCDYWQLAVFYCTPACIVVVDEGVNDSALVWLNPRLLYRERCISLWGVESWEAKITASYLNLLSQLWELQDQGSTGTDLGAVGLTSAGDWDVSSSPSFNWVPCILILPIIFFSPHIPASRLAAKPHWRWVIAVPSLYLNQTEKGIKMRAGWDSSSESRHSLCLLLESLIRNLSGLCARAAGHKYGHHGRWRPPRVSDEERIYNRYTGDAILPACWFAGFCL